MILYSFKKKKEFETCNVMSNLKHWNLYKIENINLMQMYHMWFNMNTFTEQDIDVENSNCNN